MPMREARVIALAGVFQASRLVRELATKGSADAASSEASLASIFRIDAASTAEVFGGIGGVRLGLEQLIAQLDDGTRDLPLTQLVLNVTRLARRLGRNAAMRTEVRAAVLWHQVGGGQFRLLLRRREYAMLARGLLARCTLDMG